jgi:hypothetical protein
VNISILLNLFDKDVITHSNRGLMPYSDTVSTSKCSGRLTFVLDYRFSIETLNFYRFKFTAEAVEKVQRP